MQIKAAHSAEVIKLKEYIAGLKLSCDKNFKINQILKSHSKVLSAKAAKVQNQNKALTEKLQKVETENKELHQQLQDFEKAFAESQELNKEQMQKSVLTFQKLQESVQVADEAMLEIEGLMKEKKQMEDECQWLSETIGSVIESASSKIDKDVQELKANHEREIEKLRQKIELEQGKTNCALHKVECLEEKLKNIDKTNSFLGKDLEAAIKTIVSSLRLQQKYFKSLFFQGRNRRKVQSHLKSN